MNQVEINDISLVFQQFLNHSHEELFLSFHQHSDPKSSMPDIWWSKQTQTNYEYFSIDNRDIAPRSEHMFALGNAFESGRTTLNHSRESTNSNETH